MSPDEAFERIRQSGDEQEEPERRPLQQRRLCGGDAGALLPQNATGKHTGRRGSSVGVRRVVNQSPVLQYKTQWEENEASVLRF